MVPWFHLGGPSRCTAAATGCCSALCCVPLYAVVPLPPPAVALLSVVSRSTPGWAEEGKMAFRLHGKKERCKGRKGSPGAQPPMAAASTA
eukprot:352153-Chlamydomonas_euryale.AAC.2